MSNLVDSFRNAKSFLLESQYDIPPNTIDLED